jgi:hypothetical protein
MFANLKHHLRYWGFLLLKFAGAAFGSGLALWFLNLFFAPHTKLFHLAMGEFSFDLLYTFLAGIWFQFSFGLFYLAIWDHETGSWGYMLQLGRPQIEYICPYGHGKLNVEELQITGKTTPAWTEHGDLWEELLAASKDSDSRN